MADATRQAAGMIEPAQAGSIFVGADLVYFLATAACCLSPGMLPVGRSVALPSLKLRDNRDVSMAVKIMGFGAGTSGLAITVTVRIRVHRASYLHKDIVDVINPHRIVEHLELIASVLLEVNP